MIMRFKQRFFSWFDSYDIYDDAGNVLFEVKGQLAWGHCLKIYDAFGRELGCVKEKILTFLPQFELYDYRGQYLGRVKKEFTLFKQSYDIDFQGWQVEGDFMGWDYSIVNGYGNTVAEISKELFHWTDTYSIYVNDPRDAL